MYKLLIFVSQIEEKGTEDHVIDSLSKHLNSFEIIKIKSGKVENSLLSENNFNYLFELEFLDKFEMDSLMNSKQGRELNKFLMDFYKYITIVNVDFNINR